MFKRSILVLLISIIAYNYYQFTQVEDSPTVQTENGRVLGKVSISRDGKRYFDFNGIPYGKPPVGKLRYKESSKPDNWEGIRETQQYGAECAQLNFVVGTSTGDEDCLFLNVATPKISKDAKLPVLVFIHGGLFVCGSSNGLGAQYFIDEDIILVSMNYRLASLGFLNTGDGVVRGNMGLKDQVLALQWIQNNIENFGGDKMKVTIIGESAGGASVNYHLLSPLSKGLFYRAISQSGAVLNSWALRRNPGLQAKRHAKQLNCPTSNSEEMVECLRLLPVGDILESHVETMDIFRELDGLFVPSVESVKEGAMISAHPYDLIQAGPVNKVPWLSGYNADEGEIFFAFLGKNESRMEEMEQKITQDLPNLILYENGDKAHRTELVKKLIKFYFKDGPPAGVKTVNEYIKLLGDGIFNYGITESIKLHANFHPVFPYYYAYNGEFQNANTMMALRGKYPILVELFLHLAQSWVNKNLLGIQPLLQGVGHADELPLLFRMELFGIGSTINHGDKDYDMSKKMVKLWAAFARGDENIVIEGKTLTKLESSAKEIKYLKLAKVMDFISEPNTERLKFWKANSLIK